MDGIRTGGSISEPAKQVPGNYTVGSVVEPFYFGPAPAPPSQDGGSGSSSGSSYSPVVHILFTKKKFLQISLVNLPGLVFFKEVRVLCFAIPVPTLFRETD